VRTRRTSARAGLFVVFALGCAVAIAAPLIGRSMKPPVSVAVLGSGTATYPLAGFTGQACLTTTQACLEKLPGVRQASVGWDSATLLLDAGTPSLDERAVITAVRTTGHDVKGSDAVLPALAPLSSDEVRALDALKGEWLEVRLKPVACLECAMALTEQLKKLKGVREVVEVHFRNHLAVRRDPVGVSALEIAQFIRGKTRAPVEVGPTRLVSLAIANMTCSRCIASIRAELLREDGVLSPTVQLGSALVIVEPRAESGEVVKAVERAPGPSCKKGNIELHTFKATLVDVPQ
jgi:copper chaperone CopZ